MASQDLRLNSSAFLRKISWAILSTNLFGMPLILIFVGGILNLEVSQIWDSFTRDPYFFVLSFGLIIGIGAIFVAIHYFLVLRYLKPLIDLLKSWREEKAGLKDQVDKAVRVALHTPYFTMYLSIILYTAGIAALILLIVLIFRLTLGQILSLFFTVISLGVLISFFQ